MKTMDTMDTLIELKAALREGRKLYGTMLQEFANPNLARMLSAAGMDFFIVDCEHGPFGWQAVTDLVAAAKGAGILPFVRPPQIAKESLFKPLEAGAAGLLIPYVKTPDEVRQILHHTKYAPMGERGMSMVRPHTDFVPREAADYVEAANRGLFTILQIETREAIDNLDALLSIEGVDAALVGPNDLALSYGKPGRIRDPELVAATERVIEAARAHNVIAGIHLTDAEALREWGEKGMNLLMWSAPELMILNAARAALQTLKGASPHPSGR